MNASIKRLRGLKSLVHDVVEHGSRAVERVQVATVRRPLDLLALIPAIAGPVHAVGLVHDVIVKVTHGNIRLVNRVVGGVLDVALDAAEHIQAVRAAPAEPPKRLPNP